LIVGGIHGREGKATRPILRRLIEYDPPSTGLLAVVPSMVRGPRKHISTLKEVYYSTEEGKKLLSLIDHYLPEIYVELHCYAKRAYRILTDPNRREKRGVPPLIELEDGVLIGSVSPFLLSRYRFDLCLILEVPCGNKKTWSTALRLLRLLKDSSSRSEAIGKLRAIYPSQIDRAIRLMDRWNKEHLPE
ncbi:MAG: DUF2119 family protein, partial [Candidatus Bathyarchaeota archaeon]